MTGDETNPMVEYWGPAIEKDKVGDLMPLLIFFLAGCAAFILLAFSP